jgi:flagellar protein FlaG
MQTITPVSSPPEVRPAAEVPVAQQAPKAPEPQAEHRIDAGEVAKLEHALAQHDISLRFSQDDATNSVVVQMIDQRTGEAIRQFPTEVSLSLAANFMKLQGVFLDVAK